jgi:hypothetical protein
VLLQRYAKITVFLFFLHFSTLKIASAYKVSKKITLPNVNLFGRAASSRLWRASRRAIRSITRRASRLRVVPLLSLSLPRASLAGIAASRLSYQVCRYQVLDTCYQSAKRGTCYLLAAEGSVARGKALPSAKRIVAEPP